MSNVTDRYSNHSFTRILTEDIGIMGTGSNMFRCGIAHSNEKIYLGTYGPAPAIIWKYDPLDGSMEKVGAPGEYQLDCMVEAPNGKIYIGTAYNGLVYELDPETETITDLGTPPVESTPWIFTMICTRNGDIYGAKGTGLFKLDWRTGKMENCGVVLGNHSTPGPQASYPIIRTLEERPDGIIWGDTNRWIFTFDPLEKEAKLVEDIVSFDDACYAVLHGVGQSPLEDLYFCILSRYSGKEIKKPLYVCRAASGHVENIDIAGLEGNHQICGWWTDGGSPRLLLSQSQDENMESHIKVVDTDEKTIIDTWTVEGTGTVPVRIPGKGMWFISQARGRLYEAIPGERRLVTRAVNPEVVECRCFAMSPQKLLGTYTYDCGFAFTYDLEKGDYRDHGRVYTDDHRANYGPAAFAGKDGRFLIANFGEGMPGLWVTDIAANKHWKVGESSMQLTGFSDGTVWGTYGENPPAYKFEYGKCWIPAWRTTKGIMFRYDPGAKSVVTVPEAGQVGVISEVPDLPQFILTANENVIGLFDIREREYPAKCRLSAHIAAAVPDRISGFIYIVLSNGEIIRCSVNKGGGLTTRRSAYGFGPVDRGCFILPRSRFLVGIAGDGKISVYSPADGEVNILNGPEPPPAGPAVDPYEDAWYFADRHIEKYILN